MRAPCYDTKTRTDCPRRAVGCRSTCEAWQAYEVQAAAERAMRAKDAEERRALWEHYDRVRRRKERAHHRDRRERRH